MLEFSPHGRGPYSSVLTQAIPSAWNAPNYSFSLIFNHSSRIKHQLLRVPGRSAPLSLIHHLCAVKLNVRTVHHQSLRFLGTYQSYFLTTGQLNGWTEQKTPLRICKEVVLDQKYPQYKKGRNGRST